MRCGSGGCTFGLDFRALIGRGCQAMSLQEASAATAGCESNEDRLNLKWLRSQGKDDMPRPILFAIDDDVSVLEAVVQDLRRHYGPEYRIMRAACGQAALDTARS